MAALSNGQVTNGIAEKVYSIRVANLPPTLEEDAIKLMFEKYGKVVAIIVFPKKNHTQEAFISYGKYVEAETAINEMDKVPPLSLQVEFKDKDLMAKSYQEEIKIQLDKPYHDYRFQKSHIDDQLHIKKAIGMGKPKCTPSSYQVSNYTPDDELLCPVPSDPSMYNPYEQPGVHKDLNLMYIRGLAQLMKDGRRRIDPSGRGYIFYDLPEPHHNIDELVANVCEKRDFGYYEYAPDDINDDTGICQVCSSPTAFRCQKCCLVFYCGRPCQIKDWLQHKIDCQAIPKLVKKITLQNGHESPKQNDYQASVKSSYEASPSNSCEEQPKIHMDAQQRETKPQLRRPKSTSQCKQQSPPNAHQEKARSKSPASVKSHASSQRSTNINHKTSLGDFKVESTSFSLKQSKPVAVKSTQSDDGITFTAPKNWFISKDKFERVVVNTVMKKDEYWVQKVEACDIIEKLMEKLKAFAKTKRLIEPSPNLKCILEHEEAWYRTIINTVHDDHITAFFVDFGTFASVKVKRVVPIDDFEDIPTQARRIRFVENTDPKLMNFQIGETMYIKAVTISDTGVFIVQVKEDPENTNPKASPEEAAPISSNASVCATPKQLSPRQIALEKIASFPNVLSNLEVGQEGVIMLHALLGNNEMNVSLILSGPCWNQFMSLVGELGDACTSQFAKNPDYEPLVGEFICGEQAENEWYRGIVISLNPVKLAVVDEARVFVPAKCTPMPKGYHDFNGFGLLAKEITPPCAGLAGKTGDFKVLRVSESKDSAVISLSVKDPEDAPTFIYTGETTVSAWTPKPEQKGIQWAKLTSGREVQIIEAFTHNLIYVHSMETEEAERRHRLEQEIAKCALNRKPLRDLPVVGQLVMAYYENDGNYYRAYVVRVENKTNIQIKYVDYGNEANVKFEQLFELPDDLKEERACAARIKLKDVDDNIPMTEQAMSYLSELIAHEVALTCIFTGNPWQVGVVLKTPKNENVNELLSSYLKPTWQQNNNETIIDKPIYLINQLPSLKIGDVGDQIQAIVLCFYEDPPSLMLAPNDETIIQAIQVDMVERIQEYVKNTPDHYIPRERELCIALYDGVYYRAVCMHSSATPTTSRVTFIDYGNTECVQHKDIRMMTDDFMSMGPLTTFCSLSHMIPSEKLTSAVTKRLSELLPVNELITIKIISEDNEDGTPYIDIPEIHIKLMEEKLL
ncbi:uncharacterized protein LOC131673302 isoform X2 [Phymastichus coffea]|uniref:uncharacterized protein LOC131673302 isoform X2 n=1 Tax=Phymastichus coffea TaxID=108790 RepID=UPI00273AB866|nr:uncharacterized protein LOC131673302 isoform X2 [Phymastichus coffea]